MKNITLKLLLTLLFAFAPVCKSADTSEIELLTNEIKKLEKTSKSYSSKEDLFHSMISQALQIRSKANKCISQETAYHDKLRLTKNSLGDKSEDESIEVKQKRLDLEKELNLVEKKLASCRVLLIRSDDLALQLEKKQKKLRTVKLFDHGPNGLFILLENWKESNLWLSASWKFIKDNSGLHILTSFHVYVLIFLLLFSLIAGKKVSYYLSNQILQNIEVNNFSSRFRNVVFFVLSKYSIFLFISISYALFFLVLTRNYSPAPFINIVSYGLPIYFFSITFLEIWLYARDNTTPVPIPPQKIIQKLIKRTKVLFLLVYIGYLLFVTILAQSLPTETYLLARMLFAFVLVLNLIWIIWLIGEIPFFGNTFIIKLLFSLVMIGILLTEILGYRNLSNYIALAISLSVLLILSFLVVFFIFRALLSSLEAGKITWFQSVNKNSGKKRKVNFPNLIWLRLIINSSLLLILAYYLLKIWGVSESTFHQINNWFSGGFQFGTFQIIPLRIVIGIVVLLLLLTISRWIKTSMERNWLAKSSMGRGAREAMITIIGYIGVAISAIIALSISGVNFGNLAIIVGALSVGIGFGLQNIVNNFVSGLILLFERPIKTGDWIIVGNTEGYVKKISIRSTQIQTFDRSDVIVPNSELISGQVTNWMLKDIRGRVRIPISVAYGSDTLLVHNLLLDIAKQNNLIITDGSSPQPVVLFLAFGESSLDFELRVFINNIDQQIVVRSELNFKIDQVFRENGIEIPFPQRDINIKHFSDKDPINKDISK